MYQVTNAASAQQGMRATVVFAGGRAREMCKTGAARPLLIARPAETESRASAWRDTPETG